MDNFFRRPESDTQQPNSFFATTLQAFDRILKWLAGLIRLTEEDQEDAGIYLGTQRYK